MTTESTEATQVETEGTGEVNQTEAETTVDNTGMVQHQDGESDNSDDGEDPIVALQAAWEAQARGQIAAEEREKARQSFESEQAASRQAAQQAAVREQLTNGFASTAKATKDTLDSIVAHDEQGNRIQFSDDVVQKLVAPWQAYNSTVQKAMTDQVYQQLAEAAYNALPEVARADFATKATNKPLPEYLKTWAEALAPHTDFAKSSAQDVETKIKAAEARGYVRGQKAPVGTPRAGGERQTEAIADLSSLSGAAQALAEGRIDEPTFLATRKKLMASA